MVTRPTQASPSPSTNESSLEMRASFGKGKSPSIATFNLLVVSTLDCEPPPTLAHAAKLMIKNMPISKCLVLILVPL